MMTSIRKMSLLLNVAVLSLCGINCSPPTEPMQDELRAREIHLRPLGKHTPLLWDKAKAEGILLGRDREKVSALIGRLDNITPTVIAYWTCWGDSPVAIKVQLREFYVVCVKDIEHRWTISQVTRYSTDSF